MSKRIKSLIKWGPVVILVICTLVCQGTSGKTRLRHSHRKLRCSKCPPGWGVARECSSSEDTQCVRCPHGRYSPHHSFHNPCWLCSRCGEDLFEAHPCHPAGDTICDNCHRPRGDVLIDLARDFFKKCAPAADVAVVDEWEESIHHDDTNRLLLKK